MQTSDSEQSNSFSFIKGPFKETHQINQNGMNGQDQLLREAENFRHGIRAQQQQRKDSIKEGQGNVLPAKASYVKKIDGVQLALRKTLHGHLSKVSAMHWSAADSHSLLSASQDGKMIIWDAHKAFKMFLIPLRSAWMMTCAFSPSGSYVACGGLDNLCSVYSLHNVDGSAWLRHECDGHDAYVSCCRFVDDQRIVTSGGDHTCRLFNLEVNGRQVRKFVGHTGAVMSISLLPEHSAFISGACDNSAKLWDLRDGQCKFTFAGHTSDINATAMFPSGHALATGSDDCSCKLFDLRGVKRELATYKQHNSNTGVTSLAFSKSGRLLFAGHDDFNCAIWDSIRAETAGIIAGHDNRVSCLGVPADGTALCTGSWDSLLKVWN